jgi:hypothetical protein
MEIVLHQIERNRIRATVIETEDAGAPYVVTVARWEHVDRKANWSHRFCSEDLAIVAELVLEAKAWIESSGSRERN